MGVSRWCVPARASYRSAGRGAAGRSPLRGRKGLVREFLLEPEGPPGPFLPPAAPELPFPELDDPVEVVLHLVRVLRRERLRDALLRVLADHGLRLLVLVGLGDVVVHDELEDDRLAERLLVVLQFRALEERLLRARHDPGVDAAARRGRGGPAAAARVLLLAEVRRDLL